MSTSNQSVNYETMEDKNFPYLPPCMKCQSIIDFTSMSFHSDTITHPVKIFTDEDSEYKFGILNINIRGEIPITRKHIHIVFTIDASGSMSDMCSDRRTKMEHIHHTLENMLRIFHENKDCNISVHVQSFDTVIRTIISDIPDIRESDIDRLVYLSRQIRPCGSTNIEVALKNATSEISQYHKFNPEHEIVHILLTDGEITDGSRNYNMLLELVPKDCTNIFIGYGTEHDSQLLSHLSTQKGNEYRFVDALEKAGLVYGEIIHGLLYKAIEDVTLTGINAELYDYQTNTWVQTLQIGNLLSEQSKTYHVRSKNTEDCHISMFGKTIVQTRQFQTINIYEIQADTRPILHDPTPTDLSIYILRQKTQELLYKSKKNSEKNKVLNAAFDPMRPFDDILEDDNEFEAVQTYNRNIKQELSDFHKVMLNYMKDNQVENDAMLKMLCDDIYIAYKTTGTSLGNMYTTARQTSNGRQQTYMCSATHTQDTYDPPVLTRFPGRVRLLRQTNAPTVNFSTTTNIFTFPDNSDIHGENLENDIDNYAPTQDFLSPFSSDGVVTLMREVSGNYSIGHRRSEDEDDAEEEVTAQIN
jgi:hypothetical protein